MVIVDRSQNLYNYFAVYMKILRHLIQHINSSL